MCAIQAECKIKHPTSLYNLCFATNFKYKCTDTHRFEIIIVHFTSPGYLALNGGYHFLDNCVPVTFPNAGTVTVDQGTNW